VNALPQSLNSYETKQIIELAKLGSSLSPGKIHSFHQPQASTKPDNVIQRNKLNKSSLHSIRTQRTTFKHCFSREDIIIIIMINDYDDDNNNNT
jgi:hypothetical protein